MKRKSVSMILSVLVLFLSGCAPLVTKQDAPFVDALRTQGRVTIVSYEGGHGSRFGVAIAGGLGQVVEGLSDKAAGPSAYETALNAACVAAMEESLAKDSSLKYVPRSSLGLSGGGPNTDEYKSQAQELSKQHNIYAFIRVRFGYGGDERAPITTLFTDPRVTRVNLYVSWELISPSNEVKMRARTEAMAEVSQDFFSLRLNTKDPKFESTFVELARKNAEQFISHLKE